MKNKEGYVKKAITITGILLRSLTIVLPLLLYKATPVPGFRPDQFAILICLLLPISCLYITLFVKFISQNRYQLEGERLNQFNVNLGYFALLFLNLLELIFIIWKGMDNTVFEDNTFYILIAGFESCFGIYAGVYLSDLFGKLTKS